MLQSKTYYSYDERGNLSGEQKRTYASEGLAGSTAEQAGLSNDANSVKTYHYDRFNRLVEYTDGDTVAEYEYNADNLRTAKTVNGRRTVYVWDGTNLRYETGGNGTHEYVYDPTGVHMMDGNYYVKDGHGNVTGMYDANAEFVSDTYYDAFGNVAYGDAPDPFGYSGEYHDSETGLIYLRNRYYDSSTGRFITEDPAKDGVNWYSYCAGDPVNFADPWGNIRQEDDKYGIGSVVYNALILLGDAWNALEDYRADIENLANEIRSIADDIGVDGIEKNIERLGNNISQLNAVEKILAAGDFIAAGCVFIAKSNAEKATENLFPGEVFVDMGEANAYKHAMWNMYGTLYIGEEKMKFFTDAHEFGDGNNFTEEGRKNLIMDLNNNAYGRKAGESYDKEKGKNLVRQYLYGGDLIKIVDGNICPTNGNMQFNRI